MMYKNWAFFQYLSKLLNHRLLTAMSSTTRLGRNKLIRDELLNVCLHYIYFQSLFEYFCSSFPTLQQKYNNITYIGDNGIKMYVKRWAIHYISTTVFVWNFQAMRASIFASDLKKNILFLWLLKLIILWFIYHSCLWIYVFRVREERAFALCEPV